jgi:hypothetical protein
MCIDILVILSLDEAFSLSIQKISIQSPKWYTERALRKVSLGGFLFLIIFKLMIQNLSKFYDTHIHSATIAIICNMGPSIIEMETTVAQKFIS